MRAEARTEKTQAEAAFSTLAVEEREDRIVVTLNRPEVRNAIDRAMVEELHTVCDAAEATPRIVILTGAGTTFAAGADITELRERRRADALAGINSGLFVRIQRLPLPVIAAVNGYALGGGAELAYAADFRIAAPAARFGNPETGLGIMAAAGATWRLAELVGEPLAKEILLAGRVLSAEEAKASHLVSEIHPAEQLLAAAHALADQIAASDPLALRLTKAVFHAPLGAHPTLDNIAQAVLFESEAKYERMTAFLERKEKR